MKNQKEMQKKYGTKKNFIFSYIMITLGLATYTFAWTLFLLPNKIIAGGVTGMSSVVYFLSGELIPVGIMNFVFNAIFLILGVKFLGPKFGVNTIYGIVMSSVFLLLWQQGLHVERLLDISQLGPSMCAILGGVGCGLGIGVTFIFGANSGGTDIIALIISKYHNISPGKVIMAIDLLVVGSGIFVTGSIEKVIMGYIVMIAMTFTLDMVVDGNKQTYQIMVFSNKVHEIGDIVTNEIGRGATLMQAKGCYTKKEQEVLMVMAHRMDKQKIMKLINEVDPTAFVTVTKAEGVYGQNFEKIKL